MDLCPEATNAINSTEVCSVLMSWAIRVEQFAVFILSHSHTNGYIQEHPGLMQAHSHVHTNS